MVDVDDAARQRAANGKTISNPPTLEDWFEVGRWKSLYQDGFSPDEIARMRGWNLPQVKRYIDGINEYSDGGYLINFEKNRPKILNRYRLGKRARTLLKDMRAVGMSEFVLLPIEKVAVCCESGLSRPLFQGVILVHKGREQGEARDQLVGESAQ